MFRQKGMRRIRKRRRKTFWSNADVQVASYRIKHRLLSSYRWYTSLLSNSEVKNLLCQTLPINYHKALIKQQDIDIGFDHAHHERVTVYNVFENCSVVVKKGLLDWVDRTCREIDVHATLTKEEDFDDPQFVVPMIRSYVKRRDGADWRGGQLWDRTDRFESVALVTAYYPLGSWNKVLSNGNIRLTKDRILSWLKSARHSLEWLHSLGFVHNDAKTDNFVVKDMTTVLLFDFDECWHRSDFCDDSVFDKLKQMDIGKLAFTLDDDLEHCDENIRMLFNEFIQDWAPYMFDCETFEDTYEGMRAKLHKQLKSGVKNPFRTICVKTIHNVDALV